MIRVDKYLKANLGRQSPLHSIFYFPDQFDLTNKTLEIN